MKLTKKELNKLVSFIDKEFSHDMRTLKREDETSPFDFFGRNKERDITICVDFSSEMGLYVSITRRNRVIERKYLKTMHEINQFQKLIFCIG